MHDERIPFEARYRVVPISVTDEKAKTSTSGVVRGTYEKLRGSAKKNVEDAIPRLAQLIQTGGVEGGPVFQPAHDETQGRGPEEAAPA